MRSVIGMMVNRQKFLPEAILASFCCHTIHFCDELAMLYELNKKALPESFTSQLQHEKQKLIGVFVIGESANRNHWGLYGYPRATTPELEKLQNEIYIYKDVISPHAQTGPSLCYMLTSASLQNKKNMQYSLIKILKECGFSVNLVSNQDNWGTFDSSISLLTAACDNRIYIRRSEMLYTPMDELVLPELRNLLQNNNDSTPLFIIIHLMGSHFSYKERYPDKFQYYNTSINDEVTANLATKNIKVQNEYDNSIRYTDYVLAQIIKELQSIKEPTFMLYTSDHSEINGLDNIDDKRSANVTEKACYEIPFVLWLSPEYKKRYKKLESDLNQTLAHPAQTDNIYVWTFIFKSNFVAEFSP